MQDDGNAGRALSIILAISESDAPSSAFSRISVTVESTFPDTKPTLILQRVAKRHNYRTFRWIGYFRPGEIISFAKGAAALVEVLQLSLEG